MPIPLKDPRPCFSAGLRKRFALVLLASMLAASAPVLASSGGSDIPDPSQPHPDGSIRITAPGGLILHQRIPVGTDFAMPVRFQVNAPGKGMNNSHVKIHGEVWLAESGVPMFRGQCVEEWMRPQGKMYVQEHKSTPFGGALEHGRHTAQSCRAVLVQVQLPEFGR